MKVILEEILSDFIESKLTSAYNRGGRYLQESVLFRSRLYSVLKEFENSDLSECTTNSDGTLSYTPSDEYLCTMDFLVGYDGDTDTKFLILKSLGWNLNEWVYGYFIEVLSERRNSKGRIIAEITDKSKPKNGLIRLTEQDLHRIVIDSVNRVLRGLA